MFLYTFLSTLYDVNICCVYVEASRMYLLRISILHCCRLTFKVETGYCF